MVLALIIAATLANGFVSLVGAFSLYLNETLLRRVMKALVAFSAGALLGGTFFHILPESLELLSSITTFSILLVGFSLFFLMERILYWHHCHDGKPCDTHPFTYLIMIGDGIHNFIDGLVIAASFLVDIRLGIVTTLVIILHEIPQEMGDFAVLVHGGLRKGKAMLYNLVSQMTSVVGGIVGFLLGGLPTFSIYALPFAAGGFVYIAASDLLPQLHREPDLGKSMLSFFVFVFGILLMFSFQFLLKG